MPIVKQKDNVFEPIDESEKLEVSESMSDVYARPTTGEVFKAAFRKENSLVSAAVNLASVSNNFKPVRGYDPLEKDRNDIKGYEIFSQEFISSESPEETALIKQRIDQEFKDRQTLESSGAVGFGAQMAAGATDPIYLMLMGTGLGAWGTAGNISKTAGKAAVVGGIGEVLAESVKHTSQKTRTLEESLTNVAGATLLSGILGGGMAGLSKRKFNKMAKMIDSDMVEPRAVTNGAIKESSNVFELVNAAKVEQWKVSPLIRTATTKEVPAVQQLVSEMMETPLVSKGNVEGIATAPDGGAVETRIKMHDTPLAESLTFMDEAYTNYRGGKGQVNRALNDYVLRNRSSKLSHLEFREEIGKALRRGDVHKIPEVEQSAKFIRKNVLDPLKNDAIELGRLPEGVEVKTATSYLSRIYKTKKIIAERDKWDEIVRGWLDGKRKTAQDIEVGKRTEGQARDADLSDDDIVGVIQSITDNILGAPSGRGAYQGVKVPGVLKERVFLISDEAIEDFLESDIEMIARQYTRTMGPDVELTRRFGSITLEKQLKNISNEWDGKIKQAKTDKERVKLNGKKNASIRDIEAMRDRLLGTYKMPADPNSFFVRAGRTLRDINFLRMLGGMTLSALPDMARTVAVNGLRPVGKGLVQLAKSPKRFNLSRLEAKKAAVGLDMVLNSRASSMAEIGDVYGRGTRFERGLRKTSDMFSKITLMSQWNSALKQFSGVITSDRLLVESLNSAAGTISKNAQRRMAQAGIGKPMAQRIAKQFQKFGDDGTIKLSNGHLWDDAEALQTFKAAVLKDVDRTIVTPGKGEAPLWTSSEMGKMVFQFKTFASSAHHKVLLADLQHGDSAALNGFLLSVALGSVTYGLKQFVAGRKIETSPEKLIVESLDRSGAFGYFWDVNNMLEKATRGNIGVNKLLGAPPMSRYVSRNAVGAFIGPSFGTGQDILKLTGAIGSGEFTKSDLKTLRKMAPGQNLFYMRTLLNELEEKAGRRLPK